MLPPDGSFSPQNEFKGQLSPQKDYYGLVCHPTQLLAALPRVQTHPALLSEGLAPVWWSLVHPDLVSDTQEVAWISLVPHMLFKSLKLKSELFKSSNLSFLNAQI